VLSSVILSTRYTIIETQIAFLQRIKFRTLKNKLYSLCQEHVRQRIELAKSAIQAAQISANDETKSSVGDKYETGRAMAQLEIEKLTMQLNEALKAKDTLDKIDYVKPHAVAGPGSIVYTNHGNFFLSISAGKFVLNNEFFHAISAASPLGQKILGSTANNTITFLNKEYKIMKIA
jgi:hypothetical protein